MQQIGTVAFDDLDVGKVVTDRIKVSTAAVQLAQDESGGSTSTKAAQPDITLLRGVQVNAVVIAVLTLQDMLLLLLVVATTTTTTTNYY